MTRFAFNCPPVASVLLLAALATATGSAAQVGADSAQPDFLQADMDTAVNPGQDFFQYANGRWLARNPIPAAEASWSIGNVVDEQLYVTLRRINETAAASQNPPGSDQQKIGDFWLTAMDIANADRLGVRPLAGELGSIDEVNSTRGALDMAFALQRLGVEAFFGINISQDEKQSDAMAIHLQQGGLGLPERDFYFNQEKGVAKIRREYVAHLARTLILLGRKASQAQTDSKRVMAFETSLAKASRKLEDLRDPLKNYNKMTPAELTMKDTPSILWSDRLAAWNLHPEVVIVGQPEFFAQVQKLLGHTSVPVLRDYLRLHLINRYAGSLSRQFDDEHFSFYGRVLSGQQEQRERWKRVLDAEGNAMGMVLGRIFVQEYFPPAAKQRYAAMVEAIRSAYKDRIEAVDWMSAETKAKAQLKLAAITAKVGYPEKWKDYSALLVSRNSYCENIKNAARWHFDDAISKYGSPVDRSEWDMTPQTYNAYYNPSNNEIVLPAAIFTIPQLSDTQIDDAVAYGYVGASTIGHEITHGFDDEGRQYDSAGNLMDWWTTEDARRFEEHAAVMVKQFDGYEPLPGLHINGKASLGENIADYGGVLLGLDAFKKTDQYHKGELIGGLTPLQRYFLGYALGWLSQQREEELRTDLLSDVHAPAKWRVIGPLSNIPEFYQAFGIDAGQPMWRPEADRVQIW